MTDFQKSLIRYLYVITFIAVLLSGWMLVRPAPASKAGPDPRFLDSGATHAGITVTGACIVRTKPDFAELSLGVEESATTAKEAKQAKDHVKATIGKITAHLREAGVGRTDITSEGFRLHAHWQPGVGWTGGKKWSAEERLRVRIRDLDRLADILDGALAAGANRIGSLQYRIEDVRKVVEVGREKAAAQARRKAETLAAALGGKLGPLVACTEGYPGVQWARRSDAYSVTWSYPDTRMLAAPPLVNLAREADPTAEETVIQPGIMLVEVTVAARYALE